MGMGLRRCDDPKWGTSSNTRWASTSLAWWDRLGFPVLNGFLSFSALYLDIVFSFSPAWSS